ncbi:MAG TPA: phage major tail tube protein [Gaiellales bacterium]|nr:phage major tail tube protein [Gaiellales bacterium]
MIQIRKITNGNVYLDGQNLLGRVAEATLPEVKLKTQDHKALGMEHEIEVPSGGYEKMEAKLKLAGFYPDAVTVAGDHRRAVPLTIRGNLQTFDPQGLDDEVPVVVMLRGPFKGITLGALKQHEGPEPELNMIVWYMKVTVDGNDLLEVDVMASIHRVAGDDVLARYRDIIGA